MSENADRDKAIIELYVRARATGEPTTYRNIAAIISSEYGTIDPVAVRGVIRRYKRRTFKTSQSTQDATAAWRGWLGDKHIVSAEHSAPTKSRRVVVLSDIHGRPHRGIFQKACDENPDLIVLAGDLFDASAASTHAKLPGELAENFRDETARLRAGLEYLLDNTPARLIVLRGNHDDRIFKRASELVPAYLLDFFTDPLQLLVQALPRTEFARQSWTFNGAPLNESAYTLLLEDTLISHQNFTGKYPGEAVRKLSLWADQWRLTTGVDPRLLIQAHGHKRAALWYDGGNKLLIEPGIAGEPRIEGYKASYDSKWLPGAVGAVVLVQGMIEGRWQTLLNEVRMISE